jgi:hypothetical protein
LGYIELTTSVHFSLVLCRCNGCLVNTREYILGILEAVARAEPITPLQHGNHQHTSCNSCFSDFILYTSSLRRHYYTHLVLKYNCTTPVRLSSLSCAEEMHRHPRDSVFIHSNTRTIPFSIYVRAHYYFISYLLYLRSIESFLYLISLIY